MKSKLSTALGIDTKNQRSHFEVNRLLDLYWGGSERRITGLTLRILAVNMIALLILLGGISFLGQYHNYLVELRLKTFQREMQLVSTMLNRSDIYDQAKQHYKKDQLLSVLEDMQLKSDKSFFLFGETGQLVMRARRSDSLDYDLSFYSVRVLKDMVQLLTSILPEKKDLPSLPPIVIGDGQGVFPNLPDSLAGDYIIRAWQGDDVPVVLTASAPIKHDDQIVGAFVVRWDAKEISEDIAQVWYKLLSIFAVTFLLTILLSIYLSGTISRPLKKLARSVENVRKGKAVSQDIPDFSDRMDEIGELSLVLRDSTKALEERMDMIERFAADVAHELKNPLTSLRSAVETLSIVKKKNDKLKLMDIIVHDINRLDRLISDISRVSRLDTELLRESFKKVDLTDVLYQVVQGYEDPLLRQPHVVFSSGELYYTLKYKEVDIILNCSQVLNPVVWGQYGNLVQVFENILSNGFSFTPKGGQIEIKLVNAKRSIRVEISNDGLPLPEGKEETIFERFYSERPEHEGYGHNSGLGLSICRQIITAHGGQIYAENIANKATQQEGVRFVVILQRAD